jgi:alpha,alpha-trehalase
MPVMFGVAGEHDLHERELPHLRGWRASAPVRVGTAAWKQQQIDVYGELLCAADLVADQLDDPDDSLRELLIRLADTASEIWREPDNGMWEVRDGRRHFLHSNVMCWVAVDRAIRLADRLGVDDAKRTTWARSRDQIRREILDKAGDAARRVSPGW